MSAKLVGRNGRRAKKWEASQDQPHSRLSGWSKLLQSGDKSTAPTPTCMLQERSAKQTNLNVIERCRSGCIEVVCEVQVLELGDPTLKLCGAHVPWHERWSLRGAATHPLSQVPEGLGWRSIYRCGCEAISSIDVVLSPPGRRSFSSSNLSSCSSLANILFLISTTCHGADAGARHDARPQLLCAARPSTTF